jgi:hypothetical protein
MWRTHVLYLTPISRSSCKRGLHGPVAELGSRPLGNSQKALMKTKTTKREAKPKAYIPPRGTTAPYTNYCRKDKFRDQDGRYYGNWSTSFNGACTNPFESYIEKGGVIELAELGKCSDSGINVIKAVSN